MKVKGESLDAQIEPNNPIDKYAVFIQKSEKVETFKERSNW